MILRYLIALFYIELDNDSRYGSDHPVLREDEKPRHQPTAYATSVGSYTSLSATSYIYVPSPQSLHILLAGVSFPYSHQFRTEANRASWPVCIPLLEWKASVRVAIMNGFLSVRSQSR